MAAHAGDLELATELITRGADRCARDIDYKRPIDLARQQENPEVVAFLSSTTPQPTQSLAIEQPQREGTLVAPQASIRGSSGLRSKGGRRIRCEPASRHSWRRPSELASSGGLVEFQPGAFP